MPNNKKHGGLQMRINNNLMALNAHRYMSSANAKQSKSLEKLSSGLAINSAADNAAGLAISEKMRAQINGLEQATSNAQDGISMIQTAEGALQESENILQRMRELAVQSANDTNTAEDRAEIQKEVDQLANEITRISESTEFNTKKLLDGSLTGKLHIGANEGQDLTVNINGMDAETLSVDGLGAEVTGGDVTSATASGTGTALVDGNQITVATSEVAATSGSDTADAALAASVNFAADGADLQLNGVAIATTNVQGLGDIYDAATNADTVATALQADIDAVYDGTANGGATFTVNNNAGTLEIVNDATGSTSEVDLTGSDATIAADLGFTSLESNTGTDASYTLTLTDTEGSTSATITGLAVDATSASGTGDFEGLELTLDGALADTESSTITLETGGINVSTQSAASTAVTTINTAINDVSAERANLGAIQNRLDHTINNLSTTAENMTASESRIRDVDMAKEMMEYTKLGILQQASQAMLAQANQAPQGVLQLLQ
jgi:flagellin